MSNNNNKGRQFLSDLKLYTDYLKWDEDLGRYETWEEAADKVLETHYGKYGEKALPFLNEIRKSYHNKEFLASQRNLQFRGDQIYKHNAKIYNCATTYAYSPDVFNKGFYVLLCGTGLGVNLKRKFVNQLPNLNKRTSGTELHVVQDSIEGWADAAKALISSYVSHPSLDNKYFGKHIKFDFSKIRPKGSLITGGFKAPGPLGLKQSLERIEALIDSHLGSSDSITFKSIIAYDIFMHLSDAVLSGGVRRSAMNIIMDRDDEDLVNAKTGNWRSEHPHRARSNNSVGIQKGNFTLEEFKELVNKNEGDNDVGFVFMEDEDDHFNPCFEISFNFYNQIKNKNEAVFQFCNLSEINASACTFKTTDNFSEEKFFELCRNASIIGTLQAGYTDFPYLGQQTNDIVAGEALIGVSITGWMMRPELFDAELLRKGAEIVKQANEEVAKAIGINTAARCTTVKPSGNASVVLQTESGIHPAHSKRGFRLMQLNKDSETGKYLEENHPDIIENSKWSATNTDWMVYATYENPEGTMYKDEMKGVRHLELIRLVQKNWVENGTRTYRCYKPTSRHNVSNTVIIDDRDKIIEYLFENQKDFTAVSFLSSFGDKDYPQSPFTSVLNTEELVQKYGDGAVFVSGLIVDGLHYFDNDLWDATDHVTNKDKKVTGTRSEVLLKKDWIRRVKKFARNYFKDDLQQAIYCIKDAHLWHKFNTINRVFRPVDFQNILTRPDFQDVDKYGSMACSGGQCEIPDWALGQVE